MLLQCRLKFFSVTNSFLADVAPGLRRGSPRRRPQPPRIPTVWLAGEMNVERFASDFASLIEGGLAHVAALLHQRQPLHALAQCDYLASLLGWRWSGLHLTALETGAASAVAPCWDQIMLLALMTSPGNPTSEGCGGPGRDWRLEPGPALLADRCRLRPVIFPPRFVPPPIILSCTFCCHPD